MSSNWPVRQHTPHPTPPARKFMRRCDECGADFMALATGKTGERGLWTDTGWFCSRECRDVDRRVRALEEGS